MKFFSFTKAEWTDEGITVPISPRLPIILCTPLNSIDLVECKVRTEKHVCETAEILMWKYFGFTVSGNEEEEELTDRQETTCITVNIVP